MNAIRARLPLCLALTVTFALTLGAAARLGRGIGTPVVAALLFADSERVGYDLVDIRRGLSVRTRMTVPGSSLSRIRFQPAPPLILQGVRTDDGGFGWLLNELDVYRSTLTTLMRLPTPAIASIDLADVQRHEFVVSVYDGYANGVFRSQVGDPERQLIAETGPGFRGAFWSRDWTRLVVSTIRTVTIMNGDGSDPIPFDSAGNMLMQPKWSPDGRYIVFAAASSIVNNIIPVVDAASGDILTRVDGRAPFWCEGNLVYAREEAGQLEVHLTGAAFGSDEVILRRDLDDGRTGVRSLAAQPVNSDSCVWFVVSTFGREFWLFHRPSGALIPMGSDVERIVSRGAAELTYQARADRDTELRRIALDPAAQGYEVLWRMSGLASAVEALPGGGGWLALNADNMLVLIDAARATETAVSDWTVRAFYIVE